MKNIFSFNVRKLCFALMMLTVQCIYAQNKTIIGMVTDSKQEPLIGVNVTVKGDSALGAITDVDGKYTVTVPSTKTVLMYSYIGYVKTNWAVDMDTYRDSYATKLFAGYTDEDYGAKNPPIHLLPNTYQVLLNTGITNGYGFKQQ